jgi:hypothetical protein
VVAVDDVSGDELGLEYSRVAYHAREMAVARQERMGVVSRFPILHAPFFHRNSPDSTVRRVPRV